MMLCSVCMLLQALFQIILFYFGYSLQFKILMELIYINQCDLGMLSDHNALFYL